MNDQLYLLGDVADLLDVKPYKVAYLYLTRKLPEPKLRLGNRRVFTTADVEGVRSVHTGNFQGKGSTNKEIWVISPAR